MPIADIVIPFYSGRPNSYEDLSKVLDGLKYQGEHSFFLDDDVFLRLEKNILVNTLSWAVLGKTSIGGDSVLHIIHELLVPPETRNVCRQVNIGIQKSHSDIFILLLQDIIPNPSSINQLIKYLQAFPNKLVYSTIFKAYADDSQPLYWVGPRRAELYGRPNPFWGLIACSRQRLMDIGGIEEDFANSYGFEDDEFLCRAIANGFELEYVSWSTGIHIWHPTPTNTGDNGKIFDKYYEEIKIGTRKVANEGRKWGEIYVG